ncbi:hypothetical protein POM88_032552 [Heracleum sosnowskyi]|uniref:DUF4371 domain-containing protein n=1 Tax=Heracleum sosnowskyi TaxID=360622 RepID=A0AAD8HZJ1_9APIA|nr:hypothetical protein POM88_032552 [Heracleum sosnowskyi]
MGMENELYIDHCFDFASPIIDTENDSDPDSDYLSETESSDDDCSSLDNSNEELDEYRQSRKLFKEQLASEKFRDVSSHESSFESDELRSVHSSSEDEISRKGFIGDNLVKNKRRSREKLFKEAPGKSGTIKFEAGLRFLSMDGFRTTVRQYGLNERRAIYFAKNDSQRCQVICEERSQNRKRKTLFSYFPTSSATPSATITPDTTPTVTPSVTDAAAATTTTTTTPVILGVTTIVASTPASTTPTATPTVTPTATATTTTAATSNATASHVPSTILSEIDLASLERDSGLRRPIWKYPPNVRDDIRREYIRLGAYQPQLRKDQYPPTEFGNQPFCFPCYLFENDASSQHAFTIDGFKSWKRVNDNERCTFLVHIGGSNSPHKKAIKSLEGLKNVTRHINKVINCQSLEEVKKNRLRLRAIIEAVRYLSLQACALRGYDKSSNSHNRGNLIEMVKTFGRLSPDISNVILENAPKNATYTSPKVQKDILHIFSSKVRNKIRNEVENSKFCILVDEAIDASHKEQMAIVLRFVDVYGVIHECFFDIVNVIDTTSSTLKKELSNILTRNNLSIQSMRGQGYDGASNMRGAFNGLQALFLRDCPYAYYVHCFAHRLQLALVGAAEKQDYTAHGIEVDHSVASGERETGRGLNHIGNLQRARSTMWSSHFNCVCSLIDKYGSIIVVLESINSCSTSTSSQRGEARATTERVFSAMKLLKTELRNKMGEEYLRYSMFINIEREFAEDVDIDEVIDEFYAQKNRRVQLK